jgi:hypothetical protein
MNTKKKRCKHEWVLRKFDGDIHDKWYCRVSEQCIHCLKTQDRDAYEHERESEIERLFCSDCGEKRSEHRDRAPGSCVVVLAAKIADLEDRLKRIERWRSNSE